MSTRNTSRLVAVIAIVAAVVFTLQTWAQDGNASPEAKAIISDYQAMKKTLSIDQYEPKVKRAKEQDDEFDRQQANKISSTKNEMQAYASVASDAFGKGFAALKAHDFDKARILFNDWTLDDAVERWYKYRQPKYSHINVKAIGQVVESYVPGAEDWNDYARKRNEKVAEYVGKFTDKHKDKLDQFFKQVFKEQWEYYYKYKKKRVKLTFEYPQCVKLKVYFPTSHKLESNWQLSAWEMMLNYDLSSKENYTNIGLYVCILSPDERTAPDLFDRYKIIDRGSNYLILESNEYEEYKLIHFYKGRRSLALMYHVEAHKEIARQMIFRLKDYVVSGSVDSTGSQDEQADPDLLDIEALGSTKLATSPNEPSTCQLKVTLNTAQKSRKGQLTYTPAKNAKVTFEKPRLGSLSATQAITDAEGQLVVTYTAPSEQQLAGKNRVDVQITARGENPGQYDYTVVNVQSMEGEIAALTEYEILPSLGKYYSRVTFKFKAPLKSDSKPYKASIKTQQKNAALVKNHGEKGGQTSMEMDVWPNKTSSVFYHWIGPQRIDLAKDDVITVEIPELTLRKQVKISVGVDLQFLRAEPAWKGAALPGAYHPFKLYLRDGFHPKADTAKLFKDFHIKPKLGIKQTYFAPVTIYDPKKEGWLSRFISHIEGAVIPQGSLANGIASATVEKSPEGEFFLISDDWKEFKNVEAALPGMIPYDRGSYQFKFTLGWDDDAKSANNKISTDVISIEQFSKHGEMLNGFLLPTMKSYASMVPPAGLVLYSIDTGVNLREGDYAQAVLDTALQIGGDVAGDWIGTKRMEILERPFKNIVAKARGKTVAQLSKGELKWCLKRAKQQYAGDLGGAIASWTLQKASDEIIGEDLTKKYITPRIAPHRGSESTAWEFLQTFLKGYGGYGLVVLSKNGLDECKAFDANGKQLRNAPQQIFSGPDPTECIVRQKHAIVISFRLSEKIDLTISGSGKPGKLIIITPGAINIEQYPRKQWRSALQVSSKGTAQFDTGSAQDWTPDQQALVAKGALTIGFDSAKAGKNVQVQFSTAGISDKKAWVGLVSSSKPHGPIQPEAITDKKISSSAKLAIGGNWSGLIREAVDHGIDAAQHPVITYKKTGGKKAGSLKFKIPSKAEPGLYQFRLFLTDGDSFKEAASSKTFEITED